MTEYKTYIDVLNNQQSPLALSSFSMGEDYNSGWGGNALLVSTKSARLGIGTMLLTGRRFGLSPGVPVSALMALPGAAPIRGSTDPEEATATPRPGDVLRLWPSMIMQIEPLNAPDSSTGTMLNLTLADPITYLSDRPIWGAYRDCSAAEMIGGAISLAAGGDGKPTLNPVLPNLPVIRIINDLRTELDELPYSIAAGNTLGEWLGTMEGMLGIRVELKANLDDSVEMVLTDRAPSGTPLSMNTIIDEPDDSQSNQPSTGHGRLYISQIEGRHGILSRGVVLDDPLHGAFRRFGAQGAVGYLIAGTDISVDEAARRAKFEIAGVFTEMLTLTASSRQPGLRPGRLVQLDQAVAMITTWQALSVYHLVNSTTYNNRVTLARGDQSWHPGQPLAAGPVYVTATVDGGDEFTHLEPVPRDRLGRIPVTMSFLPTAVGEEALLLGVADTDQNARLTLADFDKALVQDYQSDTDGWEARVAAYRNNEYADPYPGQADSELTETELDERNTIREQRAAALRYIAYQKASAQRRADKDRDGYVTKRDALVSDDLETALQEDDAHDQMRMQLQAYRAGTLEADYSSEERISIALLEEYERLFAKGLAEDPHALEKRDAELAKERWPPRIPLTSIEPMAGGLHGFIPGHRHGDICRIAVHNPLSAELAGFQYRSDRQINSSVVGATAGLVVEHDFGSAWSGLVFRPTRGA